MLIRYRIRLLYLGSLDRSLVGRPKRLRFDHGQLVVRMAWLNWGRWVQGYLDGREKRDSGVVKLHFA